MHDCTLFKLNLVESMRILSSVSIHINHYTPTVNPKVSLKIVSKDLKKLEPIMICQLNNRTQIWAELALLISKKLQNFDPFFLYLSGQSPFISCKKFRHLFSIIFGTIVGVSATYYSTFSMTILFLLVLHFSLIHSFYRDVSL